MKLVRALVWVSAVLVLLVNGASAYVRLAQQGVGCEPWPQCYGQTAPQDAGAVPAEDSPHFYVRAMHRLSASVAGVLFLVIAFFGWNEWGRAGPRAAAVGLLALSGFLAWIGIHTPSLVPAVTIGNVVAGMATFALLAWLAAWRPAAGPGPELRGRLPGGLAGLATAALALVVIQITLGALVNARYADAACPAWPSCAGTWWPEGDVAPAFDPFTATTVPIVVAEEGWRQAVHMVHRVGGLVVAALAALVAAAALRRGARLGGSAALLLALIGAQLALGAIMIGAGAPLAAAVAHNVISNLVLGSLAWLHYRVYAAQGEKR